MRFQRSALGGSHAEPRRSRSLSFTGQHRQRHQPDQRYCGYCLRLLFLHLELRSQRRDLGGHLGWIGPAEVERLIRAWPLGRGGDRIRPMDSGHCQTTTVVPLGNAGFPGEIMPFELSGDMAIRCFGQPGFDWSKEVQPVFDNCYAREALSPAESRNPRMAAGFLIGKFSFDVPDADPLVALHAKLQKIASYEALTNWAIWSLYLAGSGENVYWRNENQMQGCGVYSLTVCSHGPHPNVSRFPFIYAPIQPPGGAGAGVG